ncbi:hypothetical protein [Ensifer sp.]|nr:hypothetical protein [Ensifer sp.]
MAGAKPKPELAVIHGLATAPERLVRKGHRNERFTVPAGYYA